MKTKKRSKKNAPPLLWRLLKRYLENSSVHGVGYLVESGRHWTERLFWMISCGLSWWGCTIMISGVLEDFANRRTAVTVETNYLPWSAELPSLHLCSQGNPDVTATWKKSSMVSKLLNARTFGYFNNLAQPHGTEAFEGLVESLFRSCEWGGEEIDCCEAFRPLSTPMGACLSINSIYTSYADGAKGHYDDERFKLRGEQKRSLIFRLANNNYFHSITQTLYIYLLGNTEIPTEITSAEKKIGNKWKSSLMTIMDVTQQPIYNAAGVRGVPVEKRNCRYMNENENLRIYRYYGYDVCVAEEKLFRMYDSCGCISHMLPRNPSIPVCNQTQLKCISKFNADSENAVCLADCEATLYEFFQNFSNDSTAINERYFHVNLLPGPNIRYRRYVVRSKLDVVVAVGSALGLFVGASILSLVEIPYWFIVRSIDDNDEDHEDNREKY